MAGDPDRRGGLRPAARDRRAHVGRPDDDDRRRLSIPAARQRCAARPRRPASSARNLLFVYTGFAVIVPDAARRRDGAVQLQRPGRQEQHRLAGLHAQVLARPVRGARGSRTRSSRASRSRSCRRSSRRSSGTLIALALVRYHFRGSATTNVLIFLPMATPEIVLGASLLTLFVAIGLQRDFLTILIAHIMFNISYVVVTVRARLAGLRPAPRGGRDGPRGERVDRRSGR